MRLGWVAAGVCAVALTVGGCGDESSTADDPSQTGSPSPTETSAAPSETPATATPTPRDFPDCATVWVDGRKLPGGYRGCETPEGVVKAKERYCEFGKPLVTYANKFWAVPGGPVHEVATTLAQDPGWRRALRQCGG